MSLSEEQRKRIEESRRNALALRASRQVPSVCAQVISAPLQNATNQITVASSKRPVTQVLSAFKSTYVASKQNFASSKSTTYGHQNGGKKFTYGKSSNALSSAGTGAHSPSLKFQLISRQRFVVDMH